MKVELSLLNWARKNGRMREIRVFFLIRSEAQQHSGYWKRTHTFGMTQRTFYRALKNLHNLGWLELRRGSVKLGGVERIKSSLDISGVRAIHYSQEMLSNKHTFSVAHVGGAIASLVSQQKRMIQHPSYEGLRKSGVVKMNMVSESVIAKKLGVCASTAHRLKMQAAKVGLLDIQQEYLKFFNREEAIERKQFGERAIQRVTLPSGNVGWVKRNTDRLYPKMVLTNKGKKIEKRSAPQKGGYERRFVISPSCSVIDVAEGDNSFSLLYPQ